MVPPSVLWSFTWRSVASQTDEGVLMRAFTEAEIRRCFVNASQGDAKRATLPDLSTVNWDDLEVFGWVDGKREQRSYVVFDVEGEPMGVLLRRVPAPPERRRIMCSWCQDVTETDNVSMFVAPRAGAAGRQGNTVGTSICSDFACSRHVRRTPNAMESTDPAEREFWISARIQQLVERSRHFLDTVLDA